MTWRLCELYIYRPIYIYINQDLRILSFVIWAESTKHEFHVIKYKAFISAMHQDNDIHVGLELPIKQFENCNDYNYNYGIPSLRACDKHSLTTIFHEIWSCGNVYMCVISCD